MPEATAMKVQNEEERIALRAVLARSTGGPNWKECPCGWFYIGARCPDKTCKAWKEANGSKRLKLYAHADEDSAYEKGKVLGLEGDALEEFSRWGCELEFEAEVDMETGKVKLLSVDGRKIFPVKG